MLGLRIVASATILAGALGGCAHQSNLALTQWGTPCADYGLSAKACHAKFASYADYLAQQKANATDRAK
jgi:hypothetical protein